MSQSESHLGPHAATPDLEAGAIEHAAFAVARARMAGRARIAAALDPLWGPLVRLVPLSLLVMLVAWNPELPRRLWLRAPLMTIMGMACIHAGILGVPAVFKALGALARIAWTVPPLLVRLQAMGRAGRVLTRTGRLPRAWIDVSADRRRGASTLLELDPEIVQDAGGIRALTGRVTLGCDSCGALLRSTGPGLRRCEHCDHERYDPLPVGATALGIARAALGRAEATSRWELLKESALARSPWLRVWTRRSVLLLLPMPPVAAFVYGSGVVGSTLRTILMTPTMIAFIVGTCGLALCAEAWVKAWIAFRPGAAEYDRLLQREVLEAVGHQGQIGMDALSKHLRVPIDHLRRVVARLESQRAFPIYHDRAEGRLLSAFARWQGDSRCRTCGGRVASLRKGGLRCEHCWSQATLAVAPRRAPAAPALGEGEPSVKVHLDGSGTTFRAGDTIRGYVLVSVSGPRRCDVVRVRLWWAAYGTQDAMDHVEIERELRLHEHGELVGEHRFDFELQLPDMPVSMPGKPVWVPWSLTARVSWPAGAADTVEHVRLTVLPQPVPADPARMEAMLAAYAAHAKAFESEQRTSSFVVGCFWVVIGSFGVVILGAANVHFISLAVQTGRIGGAILSLAFTGLVLIGARASFLPARLSNPFRRQLVTLRLDAPPPALLGGVVNVRCAYRPRRAAALGPLTWRLSVARHERFRSVRKTSKGTSTTYRWASDRTTVAQGSAPLPLDADEVRFPIPIPRDATPTLPTENRRVEWRLSVELAGERAGADVTVLPFTAQPGPRPIG